MVRPFFALAGDFGDLVVAGCDRVVADDQAVAVADEAFDRLLGGHHFRRFGLLQAWLNPPFING